MNFKCIEIILVSNKLYLEYWNTTNFVIKQHGSNFTIEVSIASTTKWQKKKVAALIPSCKSFLFKIQFSQRNPHHLQFPNNLNQLIIISSQKGK